tara:strand:- start:8705 stop:9526 length:822 start_codon:yes stop_codon:yes gene_type:complete
MKYVILSDPHANLEALEAVLEDVGSLGPDDQFVCLGDVVGYGPDPNEVMDIVWDRSDIIVPGNHDVGIINPEDLTYSADARFVLDWTARELNHINLRRLRGLVKSGEYLFETNEFVFGHGSPSEPEEIEYVGNIDDAMFYYFLDERFNGKTGFIGHTHVPQLYVRNHEGLFQVYVGSEIQKAKRDLGQDYGDVPFQKTYSEDFDLLPYRQTLAVISSVGQPRDGLWYAGYAVYDTETQILTLRRIDYDFHKTQKKMEGLGFPKGLVNRLEQGL